MALLLGASASLLAQRQASCAQSCSTSHQQHLGQLSGAHTPWQYAGTLGAGSSSSRTAVHRLAAPLGLPPLRQQSRLQRGHLQIVAGGGGGGLGGHGGGPGRPVRGSGKLWLGWPLHGGSDCVVSLPVHRTAVMNAHCCMALLPALLTSGPPPTPPSNERATCCPLTFPG